VTAKYLKQKSSFLIAALSLVAFVGGNMLGQHGWYAFWKSVFGKADDSLIVYAGTVAPIKEVPDYTRWSQYGGDGDTHTFKQVPKDVLVPLPAYDMTEQSADYRNSPAGDVYSIGHMGSYETGADGEGSHPGVDIRTPVGTPILAIANGVVERVSEDAGGFGRLIVIRHPNVPDPRNPKKTTTLHSAYAHLSAQLVAEGEIVQKGQQIALSGQTGFATGPHLHFQIDRDDAPWHPYWPFSGAEARAAGMSTAQAINAGLHQERGFQNTVHPMLYVQANYAPVKDAKPATTVAGLPPQGVAKATSLMLREERAKLRLARRAPATAAPTVAVTPPTPVPVPAPAPATVVATASPEPQPALAPAPVDVTAPSDGLSIEIAHDGSYAERGWETVRIALEHEDGSDASGDELTTDLTLRAAYGDAEFRPQVLSGLDFKDGTATVHMLPRGRRTVVIVVQPYGVLSRPMEFDGE